MFDTIGAGAMRCLKISELAKSVGLIEPFVINTTRGIWSQALDVVSDDELRRVCEGVGLDWSECVAALDDEAISAVLEANRQRLTELGQWGVPTFAWRGEVFWGQDRIVDLESALTQAGLQRS